MNDFEPSADIKTPAEFLTELKAALASKVESYASSHPDFSIQQENAVLSAFGTGATVDAPTTSTESDAIINNTIDAAITTADAADPTTALTADQQAQIKDEISAAVKTEVQKALAANPNATAEELQLVVKNAIINTIQKSALVPETQKAALVTAMTTDARLQTITSAAIATQKASVENEVVATAEQSIVTEDHLLMETIELETTAKTDGETIVEERTDIALKNEAKLETEIVQNVVQALGDVTQMSSEAQIQTAVGNAIDQVLNSNNTASAQVKTDIIALKHTLTTAVQTAIKTAKTTSAAELKTVVQNAVVETVQKTLTTTSTLVINEVESVLAQGAIPNTLIEKEGIALPTETELNAKPLTSTPSLTPSLRELRQSMLQAQQAQQYQGGALNTTAGTSPKAQLRGTVTKQVANTTLDTTKKIEKQHQPEEMNLSTLVAAATSTSTIKNQQKNETKTEGTKTAAALVSSEAESHQGLTPAVNAKGSAEAADGGYDSENDFALTDDQDSQKNSSTIALSTQVNLSDLGQDLAPLTPQQIVALKNQQIERFSVQVQEEMSKAKVFAELPFAHPLYKQAFNTLFNSLVNYAGTVNSANVTQTFFVQLKDTVLDGTEITFRQVEGVANITLVAATSSVFSYLSLQKSKLKAHLEEHLNVSGVEVNISMASSEKSHRQDTHIGDMEVIKSLQQQLGG